MKGKGFYQKLKAIGWCQIIGGIVGIGAVMFMMTRIEVVNGSLFLIILIGIGLYSFSIYAGNLMLKRGNEKMAIILSIINQSLQIFQFKILGFGLTYSTLSLAIGYKPSEIEFQLTPLSFSASIQSGDEFFILVNVVPVLVCGVLLSLLDGVKLRIPETSSQVE